MFYFYFLKGINYIVFYNIKQTYSSMEHFAMFIVAYHLYMFINKQWVYLWDWNLRCKAQGTKEELRAAHFTRLGIWDLFRV